MSFDVGLYLQSMFSKCEQLIASYEYFNYKILF
jgi:hypothetical protein